MFLQEAGELTPTVERRLSVLVLPLLVLALGVLLFWPEPEASDAGTGSKDPASSAAPPVPRLAGTRSEPPAPAMPAVQDPTAENGGPLYFSKTFGEPGQPGSMRVWFDRRGGCVWKVMLLDHYESRERALKAEHDPEDYLLLVTDIRKGQPSLILAHLDEADRKIFPADINAAQGTAWEREDLADGGIRFTLRADNGLVLERTYRHEPGRRELFMELVLRSPDTGEVPALQDLRLYLTGPTLVNAPEPSLFGNPAVAIGVADAGGEPGEVAKLRPSPPEGSGRVSLLGLDGRELWFAGSTNRFFGAFLYPLGPESAKAVFNVGMEAVPPRVHEETGTKPWSVARTIYSLRIEVPAKGQEHRIELGLYLGPKSYRVFDERETYERFLPIMDVDLEPPCCGISIPGGRFMASVLLRLLGLFEDLVGNWGIAIMMLTLLVRGCLVPLNFRMQKSMRVYGAKMAKLKPKMDKLREQHANDPKAYQQAMMQFQREHKIMPPLGGCLPIFLTMPIYIGLFTALRVAYALRQEPFALWIGDLSQPDALVPLGIPMVHSLNVLPLLWIGMFLWMQRSMPLPSDPQQRQVQKIMRYMPLIFGVLLYNYAAGLLLYMVTSMSFSIVESRVTKKILGPISPEAGGLAQPTII